MSDFSCPICGMHNDSSSGKCRGCGADLDSLPEDINPQRKGIPEENQPSVSKSIDDDGEPGIPEYLRRRMKNEGNNQEKAPFDAYIRAIFGGLDDAEDGDESVSDESTAILEDFSQIRPAQKWDESRDGSDASKIAEDVETEKSYADSEEIPLLTDDLAENDDADDLEWDETLLNPVSARKVDDFPIGKPADVLPDVEEEENTAQEQSDLGGELESEDEEEQLLIPVIAADNGEVESYVESESHQEDETQQDLSSQQSDEQTDADELPLKMVDGADNTAEEPTSLLDSFLENFYQDNTTALAEDEDILYPNQSDDYNLDTEDEPSVADAGVFADKLATQTPDEQLSIDDILTGSAAHNAEMEEPSHTDQVVDGEFTDSAKDAEDAVFSEEEEMEPDSSVEDEALMDSIPWELFDAADVPVVGTVEQNAYAIFPHKGLPVDQQATDYQHRMIGTVVESLFRAEGRNALLKRLPPRENNKIAQLIISAVAILGVLLILFTGVTDSHPMDVTNLVALDAVADFSAQGMGLGSGNSALLVIDFSPGYSVELLSSTEKLLENLSAQGVKVKILTTNPGSLVLLEKIKADLKNIVLQDFGFITGGIAAVSMNTATPDYDADAYYLISANFANARTWIEQLHFFRPQTPIRVIASAQMTLLLQPYEESDLIEGYIAAIGEKQQFAGIDLQLAQNQRRTYALWFLVVAVFVVYLAGQLIPGLLARGTARTGADDEHTDAVDGQQTEHNKEMDA